MGVGFMEGCDVSQFAGSGVEPASAEEPAAGHSGSS